MPITLASSLIFMEQRSAVQIFPSSVRKFWNKWELRAMIIFSLSLQIVLIVFGNRRRYTTSSWVRILLWLTYLLADSAATVSLGILSSIEGDSKDDSMDPHNAIAAFWAPFLLLHLGGPDSITAYSLEDNELWLRYLLGLGVQVGVALYVFLRSWTTGTHLMFKFLAIPVFIAALIKYGERIWVLRSASTKHLRDSLLPDPDPGPDYAKYVEEISSRKSHRLRVPSSAVIKPKRSTLIGSDIVPDAIYLHEAYFLFKMLRHLYADLILNFNDEVDSYLIIGYSSPVEAFKMVEVELGFMYDVLYTKATIVYSRLGTFLRSISFLSSISTFFVFWRSIDKHAYSNVDITITYLLLVGAIVIEIYAGFVLIFSDWAVLWLTKHEKPWVNFIYQFISSLRLILTKDNRWSGSMAQYNLIGFCLKEEPTKFDGVKKFLGIYDLLEKYQHNNWEDVNIELKELIFEQLKEKCSRLESYDFKQICTQRGDYVLERKSCLNKFGWSIVEVEFDHSLLLWHIATDICYYSDLNKCQDANLSTECKASKSLSDYMLYLLVMCPLMLPKGIEQIRFRDTCAEALRFFQQRRKFTSCSRSEACMLLLQVNTEILPTEVKGDRSKSVLFDGCRLAKLLQSLETEESWSCKEKWEMISHVWVEMLSYTASHSGWNHHGQQLRRGGELLTHVRVLMSHLGLSEQFRILAGPARVTFE